jgi:hypothetical protein
MASLGIPSTLANRRTEKSRSSGFIGAKVSPQLPLITVVTPCAGEGESSGSQHT